MNKEKSTVDESGENSVEDNTKPDEEINENANDYQRKT